MQWWQAFVLTLAVEVPIVLAALRLGRLTGPSGVVAWPGAVALAVGINLTHPVLWWISPAGVALVLAEVVVAVVEGAVLAVACRRAGWPAARICLLAAGLANATSFLVGLVWGSGAAA